MNLAKLSVNRPITIIMVVLIVLMLGAVSLQKLTIDLFPELNMPVAVVMTDYPGAGPQEIENLVTRPIEEIMGTVNNVKNIESVSMVGTSMVVAEFEWGTDMNFATLQMREKIDLIKSYFPGEVKSPMVVKMDPGLMPVLQLGLTGNLSLAELKSLAEDVIQPRLERVEGVASVAVRGGVTPEIQVVVSPEKLAAYHLSITQVVQALQMENMDTSGGEVKKGDQQFLVRVTGRFQDPAQVGETVILTPEGTAVKVKDIAEVKEGHSDTAQITRVNGESSVALHIRKQSGANTVAVVRAVRKAIKEMQDQLPGDLKINSNYDQAVFIEQAIGSVAQNIILGGMLAMLVLYMFLRSIRSTLVIALSMPISIIATFVMVYFGKLNLNMMTLGGLALGVGMMVDNSIVILENIFRHRQEGLDAREASTFGADEVTNAIVASTLTTIAVFLPIVFVQGMASQLFRPLALTVSFSLFASLMVALTLVPMLSSQMLQGIAINGNGENGDWRRRAFRLTGRWLANLDELYRRTLVWSLSHRWWVVALVTVLLVGSLALLPLVGMEFIPPMDQGMLTVDIQLAKGTSLEKTNEVANQVESIIADQPEVDGIFTTVGSATGDWGGFDIGDSENAHIDVMLKSKKLIRQTPLQIVEAIRDRVKHIPGAEITVAEQDATSQMGVFTSPIEVAIRGDDMEVLAQLAEMAKVRVAKVPGTREVKTSLEEGRPEVRVTVDRDRAALYGISAAQVAGTVRAAIQGQVATRYRTGGDEIDVLVRLPQDYRQNLQHLEQLTVASSLGAMAPLREIARIEVAEGPEKIERRGQARMVTVRSDLAGRSLGQVVKEIQAALKDFKLPPGYTIEYGGESKEMQEAFGDLTLALVLAIALVYMIMAAQFESLVHPFVIMFSMPAAVIGVILALAVTGRTFGVTAFIGVILLAGIVVNNAIVLVDYVNILRKRGMERNAAIEKAGPTRLRPILMTALTTILGLLPLALGIGEGSESQAPMATAVIGGLLFSTMLTLVLVPVVYTLFDDLGNRIWRRGRKQVGATI
ncbi:multidrug ABC transporter [Clostridiales bacterium PH28_bin88]|nr:multidrug ABC transporter [Clostridiales bacterium PH28_bin88]